MKKHAQTINGFCNECGQPRPCMCGDHCPICMSDVQEEIDGVIVCLSCAAEQLFELATRIQKMKTVTVPGDVVEAIRAHQ